MLTLYGLKSCDTCRAARAWLADHGVDYHYHDLRSDGLDVAILRQWMEQTDWSELLNKRSLTWRKIPETDKSNLDESRAAALLLDYPTLVKRPVLAGDDLFIVGFSADRYAELSSDT